MRKRWSHVIGFDDGAFDRKHRGDVLLVGAVYANLRLEGMLSGKVKRDGSNATDRIIQLAQQSRFAGHLHAISKTSDPWKRWPVCTCNTSVSRCVMWRRLLSVFPYIVIYLSLYVRRTSLPVGSPSVKVDIDPRLGQYRINRKYVDIR